MDVRDKWNDAARRLYIPEYNNAEFGTWPQNFTPPAITEEEMLQDMAAGCPFSWVIDAVAAITN